MSQRVVFPASTKLNKVQTGRFLRNIAELFKELQSIGIVTKVGWSTTSHYGHKAMERKFPGKDYVFYSKQMLHNVREHGAEYLWLSHNISKENYLTVGDILINYNCVWGTKHLPHEYWTDAEMKVSYHELSEGDFCGESYDHMARSMRLTQERIKKAVADGKISEAIGKSDLDSTGGLITYMEKAKEIGIPLPK